MIADKRIKEMWEFIRKYGSGNCWTGTVGEACSMIYELLKERQPDGRAIMQNMPLVD